MGINGGHYKVVLAIVEDFDVDENGLLNEVVDSQIDDKVCFFMQVTVNKNL